MSTALEHFYMYRVFIPGAAFCDLSQDRYNRKGASLTCWMPSSHPCGDVRQWLSIFGTTMSLCYPKGNPTFIDQSYNDKRRGGFSVLPNRQGGYQEVFLILTGDVSSANGQCGLEYRFIIK